MNYFPLVQPLTALIAGVAILFEPRVLSYIVAIFLVVFGVVGLLALF